MIPERAPFERLVQAAGVDGGKPIVIVPPGQDVNDVNDAMRLYWQFKVYGETDMAILDGGMAAWLLEGRSYSLDGPVARTGSWKSPSDQTSRYFADSIDVLRLVEKGGAQLIDAREAAQYHGLVKRDHVYGYGHLAGAKSLLPDMTYKISGGVVRLYSPATYRAVLQVQGIDPAAPSVVYCNWGAQSGLPWFILSELLGNGNARQYNGSLHQWTLEKRPLVGAVPLN